jgi:hypothetical protein
MKWIFFQVTESFQSHYNPELTQPLTEMSIRNLPGVKGRQAHKADNLTAICEPIVLKYMGGSMSHSPMGLRGLLHV